MTGLVLHPLRLAALDRMSVLRVPAKLLPDPDCVWCKGHGYEWIDADPSGFDYRHPCRCIKPPYAPGEYFVKEAWQIADDCVGSITECDGVGIWYRADYPDAPIIWKPSTTMPTWAARYLLTLGPPVPCRLGEVDVVQQRDEGVIIDIGDEYRRTWDALYPKHPFSPDRWTWGYPMEVRR